MSNDAFLMVFIALLAIDYYFDIVQTATKKISHYHQQPALAGYFNPRFIRFAFPLTLIKWGWVIYWAVATRTWTPILWLFGTWLLSIFLPVPTQFALPAIRRQIEVVRGIDDGLAAQLDEMLDTWETT